MFSPHDRTLSDSMDYDDELAELHDKRERERELAAAAATRLPNPKYVAPPTLATATATAPPPTTGGIIEQGVLHHHHQQQQQQQHHLQLQHSLAAAAAHLQTMDSDEDTEDASEDGDLRNPFHLGATSKTAAAGGAVGGVVQQQIPIAPVLSAASATVTSNSGGGACGGAVGGGAAGSIDNNNEGESEENERRLKEQAYFDKLNFLKGQLEELESFNHVDYIEGMEKLKEDRITRLETNQAWAEYERGCIERDYSNEQKLIGREFEDKKIELRESLIAELEEKKKQIEMERYSTELTSDPTEVKPMNTRKLRRRPNDPAPQPERRKKAPQFQVTFLLDEREIEDDWRAIQNIIMSGGGPSGSGASGGGSGKGKKSDGNRKVSSVEMDYSSESSHSDSRIEDGKLFYEKRWFHRGQPVFVEGQGMSKVGGVICSISQDLVWVRKVNEQSKIRVPITALQKGKLFIKRRAN